MATGEAVSTGNNGGQNAGGVAEVNRKASVDTFDVTIDQLDTTFFRNVRSIFNPDKVAEYRTSLKEIGQLQNVSAAPLESGKLGVFLGFTRCESFAQNVCEPLIKKWNKDNNLASTDPNFLIVTNPLHRQMVCQAFPDEFAKEKLKKHNQVRVVIDDTVKTPGQARMKGFIENTQREDISLVDFFTTIETMINEDGITAAEVARTLKKSPSTISQYRRAKKLSSVLRDFLVTPEAGEVITEADLVKLKESVKSLCDEYDRRIALTKNMKGYDVAISFSHIREFSQRVVIGTSAETTEEAVRPITRLQTLELLCELVGADTKSFKVNTDKPPKIYGLWMAAMKSMEDVTKAKRSGKTEAPAADAATEAAAATGDIASGSATGTVEGLAAQQAEAGAAVSTGNSPAAAAAEANADTPVAAAPGQKPATEAETQAKADALVGGGAEDTDSDEPMTGATKKKVQSAPLASAKVKEANVILSAVQGFLAAAAEPESPELDANLGLYAAALQGAQFGYEMLGLDAIAKALQKSATEYCESLEAYVIGLEDYAAKASKSKGGKIAPFTMERPVPVLPAELVDDVSEAAAPADTDSDAPMSGEAIADEMADLEGDAGDSDSEDGGDAGLKEV